MRAVARSPSPPPDAAGQSTAWLHLAAILGLLLTASLLAAVTFWLLASAAADPARTGRFTVFFPANWPVEARLLAIVRSNATPIRQSWLLGALEAEATTPAAAARFRAEGASLVLPGLAFDMLAAGGCSGGMIADYPDRPALRKLRAGPM